MSKWITDGLVIDSSQPLDFVEMVRIKQLFSEKGEHHDQIGGKFYCVRKVTPFDDRTINNSYNEKNQPKGRIMNQLKSVVRSTKKFVYNHRTALAFTAGATAALALNRGAIRELNNFLKDNDLYETFYNPTES